MNLNVGSTFNHQSQIINYKSNMIQAEILCQSPIFRGISEPELNSLFGQIHYQVKIYQKSDLIVMGGEICDRLLIIQKGSVKAEMSDYSGKTIAIFGLGDSVTYSNHFVNAMGVLAKELQKNGATIVGKVDPSSYEFDESEAIFDGMFIGLPIDEDFQPELTDERVASWVKQLASEFGF